MELRYRLLFEDGVGLTVSPGHAFHAGVAPARPLGGSPFDTVGDSPAGGGDSSGSRFGRLPAIAPQYVHA